ncbi:NEL-type E3 ubiquitin ligase domain-containing protein [Pseudomonas sp. microsymbiont 2]
MTSPSSVSDEAAPAKHDRFARQRVIESKLPAWISTAKPADHQDLRKAIKSPPSWFLQARLLHPQVARTLADDYAAYRQCEADLAALLAPLPDLDAFASKILTPAFKKRFGLDLDMSKTYLVNPRKAVEYKLSFDRDPLTDAQRALKLATQSLLRCAMQNFEASEAQPGGMDADSMQAVILDSDAFVLTRATGNRLPVVADQFAALSRELDIGGQYQALIDATWQSAPAQLLSDSERYAFRVHAHLAYMREKLSESMYEALLELSLNNEASYQGSRLQCNFITLWKRQLTGALIIGVPPYRGRLVCYLPGASTPLVEYPSIDALIAELPRQLLDLKVSSLQRLLPARYEEELMAKLQQRLIPMKWDPEAKFYRVQPDPAAEIPLGVHYFGLPFLDELVANKKARLKDDAAFHAVSTASEDEMTAQKRKAYFIQTAFQVLNVAAFFVPGLGPVMMGVTALQIGFEVFDGLESWANDDREQALGYLVDVMENVALFAALGVAGAGAGTPAVERAPVETPSFIEELKPVEMPDGKTRFWYPDLAPFAHDVILPADLKPDEFGLYHYQGKTWLALEDKVYSVSPTGSGGQYRLEHPSDADRYPPIARHNGAGTWQHELDQPLEWQGHMLVRRVGLNTARIDASTAQRVLWVSGTSETVLRGMYSDNLRPPALFEDTLERFRLDEQVVSELPSANAATRAAAFETRYQALHANPQGPARAIRAAYPSLPGSIAEELARNVNADELLQLQAGKVPLRLSQEIRIYQQHLRLQRAYEGLYLESVRNPDTDTLILHSIERLPGWSSEVRIELRDRWFGGRLLDSIGVEDAGIRKVLVRQGDGFEAFDSDGLHLHGRDSLYAAVLHALPDAPRANLGFPGSWEGERLKAKLQGGPLLPRSALRELLKMQPRHPAGRSPMRLADGRVGYPLSGRGVTNEYIVRETLLDMIRLVGLPRRVESAEQLLGELEAAGFNRQQIHARLCELLTERTTLSARLDAWGDESSAIVDLDRRAASRGRILEAIWQHWSDTHLPELGRSDTTLRLEQVFLIDFPSGLPDFFLSRVQGLQLIDVEISGLAASFDQALADPRTLGDFYQGFTQLTSLDLSQGRSVLSSRELAVLTLSRIDQHLPRLRVLSLRNQGITFTSIEADRLRRLSNLEHLDLSGNRLGVPTGQDLMHGLSLRFLGLDRMGLGGWPIWLDEQVLSSLQSLSMRDNYLQSVPDALISDARRTPPQTMVSLQGNPIQSRYLMQVMLRDNPADARFVFEVDVSPSTRSLFDESRRLHSELRRLLDNWQQAPSTSGTSRARAQISDTLLAHLHTMQMGERRAPLSIEAIDLADFPSNLPERYLTQIQDLHLVRISASAEQLNTFLGRFQELDTLTLEGFTLPSQVLPEALVALPELQQLNLYDIGLQVNQQTVAALARMPRLQSLALDGNRIGVITDASRLSGRLQSLSLINTGLEAWPAWVEVLFPLETLGLDNNRIIDLPERILYNPRNPEGQTEISLLGNPLSEHTMQQAHASERYERSYTFNMDLPDSIANDESRDRHASDTESEAGSEASSEAGSESGSQSEGHIHSPPTAFAQGIPDIEPWLLGGGEENAAHRTTWQTLLAADDAPDLLGLVGRLTEAASYRTSSTRAAFATRVWQVLEIAAASMEQRQLFNVIAQEAAGTCADGAWLLLNQMEIRVFTDQAVRDAPALSRGSALYRLTVRLYRLQELDDIARANAGSRDEAEVRLAYRLHWAQELDLPLPPSSMLFRSFANLRRGELDEVLAQVQRGEHGDPFIDYAVSRDYWVDYLKEVHADRFAALEQDYRRRVLAIPDEHPRQTIEQLQPIYDRLQVEYGEQVLRLIRELTITEGHAHLPG